MNKTKLKKYVKANTTDKVIKKGVIYELLGQPKEYYLVRVNGWSIRSAKVNFEPIK